MLNDVLRLELPLRVVLTLGRRELRSVLLDRKTPPGEAAGLLGTRVELAAVFAAVVA